MHDWRAEYDGLLPQLPRIVAVAVNGDTGRAEDDVFVKVAIVAFGRHAPQTEWDWNHLMEVRRWRTGDYSDEALASYGPTGARRYAFLACAWLGTVLALFQMGSVTEAEALAGYALLPGFVAADAFQILERPLE